MSQINVIMRLEKETKGALRYQEFNEQLVAIGRDEEGAKIGTLYLRKIGFPDGKYPQALTVTINVPAV